MYILNTRIRHTAALFVCHPAGYGFLRFLVIIGRCRIRRFRPQIAQGGKQQHCGERHPHGTLCRFLVSVHSLISFDQRIINILFIQTETIRKSSRIFLILSNIISQCNAFLFLFRKT